MPVRPTAEDIAAASAAVAEVAAGRLTGDAALEALDNAIDVVEALPAAERRRWLADVALSAFGSDAARLGGRS